MSDLLKEATWQGKGFTGSNGEWKALAGGTIEVQEPATGKALTKVGLANAKDVRAAAAAAKAAQVGWAKLPYQQRAAIFRKAATLLEENRNAITTWIVRETGSSVAALRKMAARC